MTRISEEPRGLESVPTPSRVDSMRDRASRTLRETFDLEQYPRNFWLCTLLLFLVELGCSILGAPSPKLLEMAVCRSYFQDHLPTGKVPDEELCKSSEVQNRFIILLTGLTTLSTLMATVMQLAMGTIADKRGRHLALRLNIASNFLYWGSTAVFGLVRGVPIWCFYLAPIFILVGGGPWATGPLLFSAISNNVNPQKRTTAFSIMEATSGVADLIGPVLGTLTMTTHISIPFLMALFIFGLMYIPVLLITDDIPKDQRNDLVDEDPCPTPEYEPLLRGGDNLDDDIIDDGQATKPLLRSRIEIFVTCFGSFFLFYLARTSTNYIIPWVSLRFDISMAYAGLIFSLRAIVSLVLYFILVPFISSWLTQAFRLDASTKDLVLSTGSTVFSSTGFFIVALAPNVPVLWFGFAVSVLGSGMTVTLRSFLASNVDPAFSGRLFTAISTTGTIGTLTGTPLMGAIYSWGINHGAVAIGYPFLLSAISYILILGLLVHFQFKHWCGI